jgi:hypothetical protein
MDHGDKPNVIYSWTAHPAGQHRWKACIALAVIALVGLGVAMTAGHPVAGLLGSLLLVVSLQRFFFPSTFEVDADGITAKYLMTNKRARWRDVRRFVTGPEGGYLSTRSKRSWLDAYRGLHVVFGANRDEAIAAINAIVAATESAADGIAPPAQGPQPIAHSHRAAENPA